MEIYIFKKFIPNYLNMFVHIVEW